MSIINGDRLPPMLIHPAIAKRTAEAIRSKSKDAHDHYEQFVVLNLQAGFMAGTAPGDAEAIQQYHTQQVAARSGAAQAA